MGQAASRESIPDLVGAYGYNNCTSDCHPCMNATFCCGAPRWFNVCWCKTCSDRFTEAWSFRPENHPDHDPQWREESPLRREFEARLQEPEFVAAFERPQNWADQINQNWCGNVNRELLNAAGYSCRAHYWMTVQHRNDSRGESTCHVQMQVLRKRGGGAVAVTDRTLLCCSEDSGTEAPVTPEVTVITTAPSPAASD
jgi:hypothetical protein